MWSDAGVLTGLVASFAVFARGFLPPTRLQTGYSTDPIPDVPAQFDRVVFMVVDALRSDFVYSTRSEMSFVHSLISSGQALPFTAYSDPPTVTLPRLKGLTTGSAPNFLDAVVNIAESDTASVLANQDSWVAQFHLHNKSIHMFGDDTWLKLFPDVFSEFEGTSSFFVSDYMEVDHNVTRHLSRELNNQDWDCLILHYLGLDHIGHKGGPNSPLMPAKQAEMDGIVRTIWDKLDDRTLLVLAGDHGMNEVGNHGGASSGETSAALVLASKRFNSPQACPLPTDEGYKYYSRVQQVDLVTSLAVLLGLPVPLNSLGLVIPNLYSLWPQASQAAIQRFLSDRFGCDAPEKLEEFQEILMRSTSAHVLPLMYTGVGALAVLVVASLAHVVYKRNSKSLCVIVLCALAFVAMLASSFVEEEHYLWYWYLTALIGLSFRRSNIKSPLLHALALRVVRGWHGAGQKWATLGGTGDWLVAHPNGLWLCVLGSTLVWVYRQKYRMSAVRAAIGLLAFKLISAQRSGESVFFNFEVGGTTVMYGQGALALALLHVLLEKSVSSFEVLLAVQSRPENIPLIGAYALARSHLPQDPTMRGIMSLCWQYTSFYASGGSNSIATLDLSQAYNGVSGYILPLVGFLGYVSNWAGPAYWALGSPVPFDIAELFYSSVLLGITLACTILREHLFIWTVFSPKLLYAGGWLVHEILSALLVKK